MRRVGLIIGALVAVLTASAEEPVRRIEQVNVTHRALRESGMQTTHIDTIALHESPALSLGEVLAKNTNIFVKSYGRGTLSTPSLRGTSSSHTKVLWNGLELNSPLLGSVDLSTIPGMMIDRATVRHGASSVESTTGGLGGAVALTSSANEREGLGITAISGIGSFLTFDEFVRVDYTRGKVSSSTRVAYSYSQNDFPYTNYYKKCNLRYDSSGKLIGWDYPEERNQSGSINDMHALQSVAIRLGRAGRLDADVWYSRLERGVPMLSVSYRKADDYSNTQNENTLRTALRWQMLGSRFSARAHLGYIFSDLRYNYNRDVGDGERITMIDSGNKLHTLSGGASGDWFVRGGWMFTAGIELRQDMVSSRDYRHSATNTQGEVSGYDNGRFTADAIVSAKWSPNNNISFGATLREELCGDRLSSPIPALFAEGVLSETGNVIVRASATRNYRFPTLNDLYYKPGGNPALKPEEGISYDIGISADHSWQGLGIKGRVTWFDSYISNWILWLPTFNGYWSPTNVRSVHSYGIESSIGGFWEIGHGWRVSLDGCFAWTPAINRGDEAWNSAAHGKQLVYIPEYSSSIIGAISWRGWELRYHWNYYSERYTTSSNQTATRLGVIQPYFMSDISLGKRYSCEYGTFGAKFTINNLLNEEYESVLSRPMPRQNYYLTLEFAPAVLTSRGQRNR